MRTKQYQRGKDKIIEESIVINNYRDIIFEENINPIKVLENSVFNIVSKTKTIGHYQYDKEKKHFIYREQANIHNLKQMSIEKREGKYYLSYFKNSLKFYFSKYNLDIFDLLVEFYNNNDCDTKLRKAS